MLFVVRRETDFAKVVSGATAKLAAEPGAKFWSLPDGVHFGQGESAGKLGVLFPGQGSQSVGMLRDLACTFPEFLQTLVAAEAGWTNTPRLTDFVYPHSAFTAEAKAEQERQLRATDIAQPALGAVSLGAWEVLRSFGIQAEAFAGHSYGELTALCAAGAIERSALHHLSRERGQLMASFAAEDAGGMLAVKAPLSEIESALAAEKLDLVIANRNSPTQCVLSGAIAEIARAEQALKSRGLSAIRLPVAAAFHSPLVARASKPFRDTLETIAFRKASVPVFANRDGRRTQTPPQSRNQLAEQLAQPVEFVKVIAGMAAAGEDVSRSRTRTFSRAEAEATLKTIPDVAADCFAVDASSGKRSGMRPCEHPRTTRGPRPRRRLD